MMLKKNRDTEHRDKRAGNKKKEYEGVKHKIDEKNSRCLVRCSRSHLCTTSVVNTT